MGWERCAPVVLRAETRQVKEAGFQEEGLAESVFPCWAPSVLAVQIRVKARLLGFRFAKIVPSHLYGFPVGEIARALSLEARFLEIVLARSSARE